MAARRPQSGVRAEVSGGSGREGTERDRRGQKGTGSVLGGWECGKGERSRESVPGKGVGGRGRRLGPGWSRGSGVGPQWAGEG